MATDLSTLDALYPLDPSDLPRQWVLTTDSAPVHESWQRHSLQGWHLNAHPDAHVVSLFDRAGKPLGWIIEPLVCLSPGQGHVPTDTLTLDADSGSPDGIERALYGRDRSGFSNGEGIEGMWVAVVLGTAAVRRVYLGSIHSVVYSAERRAVATTHNLIPALRRNVGLSRAFDPLQTHRFYTFGTTAFEGLKRLLPNHYLDLATFHEVRHWPRSALAPLADGRAGAAAIADHATRMIRALSTQYRSYRIFLSAGRDSRAVLATLRPLLTDGSIDLVLATTVGHDIQSRVDVQAGGRLAQIAGLPHEVTQRAPHSGHSADSRRAFARIGESKAGPILSAPGVMKAEPGDGRFVLAGIGGEVGRAYFRANTGVSPEILARRTGSPEVKPVLDAAGAWLGGLPADFRRSARDVLDLAYIEQKLGGWESSTRYLFPGRPRVSSPMTAAYSLETMLRLPERYRASRAVQRDMVAHCWPELLAVPFNRPQANIAFPYYRAKFVHFLKVVLG